MFPALRNLKYGIVLAGAVAACAQPGRRETPAPVSVNTGALDIASNAAADSLLVDVRQADSSIAVDMRYATINNFMGEVLPGYEANRAFLLKEVASAIARVQKSLAFRGLGLKIFDAYRPVRATEAMVRWTERVNRPDLISGGYIASRSRHNLGVAVDLTLVDLATRAELDMGTPFDTFSPAAHTENAAGNAARNRQLLKAEMRAAGFVPYDMEWWHFSFPASNPVRFDRIIR